MFHYVQNVITFIMVLASQLTTMLVLMITAHQNVYSSQYSPKFTSNIKSGNSKESNSAKRNKCRNPINTDCPTQQTGESGDNVAYTDVNEAWEKFDTQFPFIDYIDVNEFNRVQRSLLNDMDIVAEDVACNETTTSINTVQLDPNVTRRANAKGRLDAYMPQSLPDIICLRDEIGTLQRCEGIRDSYCFQKIINKTVDYVWQQDNPVKETITLQLRYGCECRFYTSSNLQAPRKCKQDL